MAIPTPAGIGECELEPLLTPDHVCERLQVTKTWLYDQVQAEAIPNRRLGTWTLRFCGSKIRAYVDGTWMPSPTSATLHTARRGRGLTA